MRSIKISEPLATSRRPPRDACKEKSSINRSIADFDRVRGPAEKTKTKIVDIVTICWLAFFFESIFLALFRGKMTSNKMYQLTCICSIVSEATTQSTSKSQNNSVADF